MIEQLTQWAPLLTILVSLGGLQLSLYMGLRADLRGLTTSLSDVRERLAALEVRVEHLESRLPAA